MIAQSMHANDSSDTSLESSVHEIPGTSREVIFLFESGLPSINAMGAVVLGSDN